jgi:hypothetical protein
MEGDDVSDVSAPPAKYSAVGPSVGILNGVDTGPLGVAPPELVGASLEVTEGANPGEVTGELIGPVVALVAAPLP